MGKLPKFNFTACLLMQFADTQILTLMKLKCHLVSFVESTRVRQGYIRDTEESKVECSCTLRKSILGYFKGESIRRVNFVIIFVYKNEKFFVMFCTHFSEILKRYVRFALKIVRIRVSSTYLFIVSSFFLFFCYPLQHVSFSSRRIRTYE